MKTEVTNAEHQDLAAEYVLGTLQGEARDQFERRLTDDDALRHEVYDWERRLEPLLETVEPVTPPDRVWRGIKKRIAPTKTKSAGVWNSLSFWRGNRIG